MSEAQWINETLQWAALALGVLIVLLELPRYREVRNRPAPPRSFGGLPDSTLSERVAYLEQEILHDARIKAGLEERVERLEERARREVAREIPPVARPPVPRRGKPEES